MNELVQPTCIKINKSKSISTRLIVYFSTHTSVCTSKPLLCTLKVTLMFIVEASHIFIGNNRIAATVFFLLCYANKFHENEQESKREGESW